jgi:hypothetical protein
LPKPLQININGEVGTGKLHFITILFSILSEMASSYSKPLLLAWAIPTNVTAFNINGWTIYKLLKLPI